VITVLQVMEATEGGTRRHLRDLVSALEPQAFRVVLAVSCGRDAAFRARDVPEYEARGVPVHEVPMQRGIAPAADLLSLARLVRVIRSVRPDVVHAHSAKAGFLARLAALACGVPAVYTPHAFPFLVVGRQRARRLYRFLERSVRGATAALIAVSEEEAGEALRLGYARERVFLIRNGVAACEAGAVTVREDGALRVGFFGRLARQKGPDVLLEAVADVVAHLPLTRFSFTGDGELAEPLRARAEALGLTAVVAFAGACAQGETVARMREVDVVAAPSR
jgi:glycosyltransferase involved in cell wall biosynthesis